MRLATDCETGLFYDSLFILALCRAQVGKAKEKRLGYAFTLDSMALVIRTEAEALSMRS